MPELRLTRTLCLILSVLLDEPCWGLRVCQLTGLASGSVYPALQRLEAAAWITGRWEEGVPSGRPPRKIFEITTVGRVELADWRSRVPAPRAAWLMPPAAFGPASHAGPAS